MRMHKSGGTIGQDLVRTETSLGFLSLKYFHGIETSAKMGILLYCIHGEIGGKLFPVLSFPYYLLLEM